jgi:DNA polymerase III subunit delta
MLYLNQNQNQNQNLMQLHIDKLEQHLNTSWNPPYILSGSELLLIEQAKDLIYSAAKKHNFERKQLFSLDGVAHGPWDAMLSCTKEISLFGELCFIYANLPNGKAGKYGGEAIMKLAQQKAGMVLTLPKLDKATQQNSWFVALNQHGTYIDIPTIDSAAMPSWIKKTAMQLNITFADANVLSWLSHQFAGNLISAYQELKKLSLVYADQKAINLEQAQKAVVDIAQYQTFDLIDACLNGHKAVAMDIIGHLSDDIPVLCIWLFIEDISLLLNLKQQVHSQGKNLSNLLKELRIWGKKTNSITYAFNNHSTQSLHKCLELAYDIELQIKGVKPHSISIYQLMQRLCLQVCK